MIARSVLIGTAVLTGLLAAARHRTIASPQQELQEPEPRSAHLHLIDTGEGQAVLIDLDTIEVLIDGGESPTALKSFLASTRLIDGPIELVIVSQSDLDSYGGFRDLFAPATARPPRTADGDWDARPDPVFMVNELWLPADHRSRDEIEADAVREESACPVSQQYDRFARRAAELAGRTTVITERQTPALVTRAPVEFEVVGVPGVHFTLLSAGWTRGREGGNCSVRKNNAGTVLMLRLDSVRVLLGGEVRGVDAVDMRPTDVEADLLALTLRDTMALRANILVVPRKGSEQSSSPGLIRAISPRYALFGSSIRFDHPRASVIARYRAPGRRLLTTRLRAAAGVDHIVCDLSGVLDCQYGGSAWTRRLQSGESVTRAAFRSRIQRIVVPTVPLGRDPAEALARVDTRALERGDFAGLRWNQRCAMNGLSLRGSSFRSAELQGCQFVEVDLRGADFTDAQLTGATFRDVTLDSATFNFAQLDSVRFIDATMDGVKLRSASLRGVVFEPTRWSLTTPSDLWRAADLASLRYERSPRALIELRAQLREAGLRTAERELTYTIEKTLTASSGSAERAFRWIAFEVPSEYGRRPLRPLAVMLALIPVFALVYWIPIRWRTSAAVYRVPPEPAARIPDDREVVERVTATGARAALTALHFSVLNAFHVGWRDLNVGSWLARLQPAAYTLSGSKWVRTVTGLQALISVYLLALSVLSYFGRPFG